MSDRIEEIRESVKSCGPCNGDGFVDDPENFNTASGEPGTDEVPCDACSDLKFLLDKLDRTRIVFHEMGLTMIENGKLKTELALRDAVVEAVETTTWQPLFSGTVFISPEDYQRIKEALDANRAGRKGE